MADTDQSRGEISVATERGMGGMGTCEFPEEEGTELENCGDVTEHVAAVLVDNKIQIVPLCSRHAGSFPEEYIHVDPEAAAELSDAEAIDELGGGASQTSMEHDDLFEPEDSHAN
ncbi:hypothetical protein ACFQDD_02005 [Halorubrum pallidum]|uniref:Uncharacterized protein n=1 Tax=Halorubrum pallidum TaxID=1526114 RepID=A0ABD5T0M4_9EURY